MKIELDLSEATLDQDSLTYYREQYSKLTDLTAVTLKLSDYAGHATNFHSLNLESLVAFIELYNKQVEQKEQLSGVTLETT